MEIEEMLEKVQKEVDELREELQKEMTTGEQIYESLCYDCKRTAEKIIEEDGVINCWDDMLEKHAKDRQSEVQ